MPAPPPLPPGFEEQPDTAPQPEPTQEAAPPPLPAGFEEHPEAEGDTYYGQVKTPSGLTTLEKVGARAAGLVASLPGGFLASLPGGGIETPTGAIMAGAGQGATDYLVTQALLHTMDEYGDTPMPNIPDALIAAGIGGGLGTLGVGVRAGAKAFPNTIGAAVKLGQTITQPITKAITYPIYAGGRAVFRTGGKAIEGLLAHLPSSASRYIDPSQELDDANLQKLMDFGKVTPNFMKALEGTPQAAERERFQAELDQITLMNAKSQRGALKAAARAAHKAEMGRLSNFEAEPTIDDPELNKVEQIRRGLEGYVANIRDTFGQHKDRLVRRMGQLIVGTNMKNNAATAALSLKAKGVLDAAKGLTKEEFKDLGEELFVEGRTNLLAKYGAPSSNPLDQIKYDVVDRFGQFYDDLYNMKRINLREVVDRDKGIMTGPIYEPDHFPGFIKPELRGNPAIERIMLDHPEYDANQLAKALQEEGTVRNVMSPQKPPDPYLTPQQIRRGLLDKQDTDIARVLTRSIRKESPRLSIANTFNGQEMHLGSRLFENQGPVDVPEAIHAMKQYLLDKGYSKESKLLDDWIKFTNKHAIDEADRAMRAASGIISNDMLGYSALTSVGETPKILTMAGPINSVRGLSATAGQEGENARQAIEMMVGHSPMAEFMEGSNSPFGPINPIDPNKPIGVTGNVESNNRILAARGAVGYVINIAKRAAKTMAAGEEFSPRLQKEAYDMFDGMLPGRDAAKRLGTELLNTGQVSLPNLLMAGNSAARRWYYTQHLIDTGKLFASSGGALSGLYKGYAIESWKMLKKDILDPMLMGANLIREGRPGGWGLMELGFERGVRHGIGSALGGGTTAVAKAMLRGNAINYKGVNDYAYGVLSSFLGQFGGFGGDMAGALAGAAIGSERFAQDPFGHPATSLASQSLADAGAAFQHIKKGDFMGALPRGIRLAGRVAGLGDPNAPLVANMVGNLIQYMQGPPPAKAGRRQSLGSIGDTFNVKGASGFGDLAYPSQAFLDAPGQLPNDPTNRGQLPGDLGDKVRKYDKGNVSADYAMSELQRHGFTRPEAAAMVGNLVQESGLSSTIVNKKSGAFGLMQWLGPRLAGLKDFAAERGKDYTDPAVQLAYVAHESRRNEAESYRRAGFGTGSTDVAGLTDRFAKYVERMGEQEANYAGRRRNANAAYARG